LDVTGPVVLFFVPELVAVTFTVNVQDALAARVAPESEMLDDPATAVIAPPPHEPVRPFGVETTRPDGSVSETATPVSCAPEFGFAIVNVSDVLAPTEIDDAPNTFEMVGGAGDAEVRNGM
jgi:hypothetical protein